MIDDELLQELLAKASGLYNSGDYHGAIAAWKEALAADPSSQKAREGIQMATLLLGDWDPAAVTSEGPDAAAPSDGAETSPARLTPGERAARLDAGVKRVRALLLQRQYSAAIEGARGLIPIDPDSDELQRLIEEAQQAFESAPFIDEHLTLARELAAQERFAEAEVECRKVFALDPANPDALTLAAELRAKIQAAEGGTDPGGVTMKMEIADLMAAQERPAGRDLPDDDEAPAGPAAAAGEEATAEAVAPPEDDVAMVVEEDAPAMEADAPVPDAGGGAGDEAAAEAAVVESLPDDLLDLELLQGDADAAGAVTQDPAPPVPEPVTTDDAAAPGQDALETIDAETVVPATVRLVPRTGDESESVEAFLEKTEDVRSIPLAPPASAAPRATAPKGAPIDPEGWEKELESLNIKSGEHEIVGRSATMSPTPGAPAGDEMDLSSLLDDGIGGMDAAPGAGPAPEAAGPAAPPPVERSRVRPSPVEASPAEPAPLDDPEAGAMGDMAAAQDMASADRPAPAAMAAPAARAAGRERRPAAPPRPRQRPAVSPAMFAVLGVVILAGAGTVWWFFYQPKAAVAQAAAPPAGDPPADRAGIQDGSGMIPTPLGSTSRQPAETAGTGADVAATAGQDAPAAGDAGAAPEPAAQVAEPPPPPPRPRPSPEELRRQAVQHLADGRRLMAAGKWQEARTALAAALALDPVNFECKELLDQVQAKVDEEVKVTRDLDEARRAFADKDYQAALWKLYRLPRDPRLGDVERYIRNSWFNWAVVGLKGGDATDARQKLSEVLTVDPQDEDATRLLDVAERYSSRAKDRAFYAFVDSLKFRAFDHK